jgi:hypothetical protein
VRDDERPDDVDGLFAHLEIAPLPAGLIEQATARALARRTRSRRWQLALAVAGYAALLAAITVLAFAAGRDLVAGGADGILALAIVDPAAVGTAPRDFLWALLESVPWGWLVALVAACGALAWCVRYVTALLATPPAGGPKEAWRA